MRGTLRFISLGCLILLVCGCGSPNGKAEVKGRVTWNGKPIPYGHITFFSAPLVPAGAGPIKDGEFDLLCNPGQLTVEITASREGKYDENEKAIAREQYIPEKYNQQTELTAEVQLDGENKFTFALRED